jgi:hypothetical protein
MASLRPPSLTIPPSLPLALTIRFSASVPDLDLDILNPSQTTVISLKHLIRNRLIEPNSQRRLRFIQGGKILPDNAALSSVLRPPPPLASTPGTPRSGDDATGYGFEDPKGKGKNVANRPPAQRIYVNCSIGDSLTDEELKAEAKAAAAPASESPSPLPSAGSPLPPGTPLPSTTPSTSRGFDRLLSAGFTAVEVNQLRLQFRSIHSSRFTPDTLPSPDSFRRLEDSWIDDNGAAIPAAGAGLGAGSGGFESEDVGIVGNIDTLIWGFVTGFIWPLGSFGWLLREPGIHSERWRLTVGFGLFFSLLIGIVRGISGDR